MNCTVVGTYKITDFRETLMAPMLNLEIKYDDRSLKVAGF
jgi:hypothetical protein